MRRGMVAALDRLQGTRWYRLGARLCGASFTVRQATPEEMRMVLGMAGSVIVPRIPDEVQATLVVGVDRRSRLRGWCFLVRSDAASVTPVHTLIGLYVRTRSRRRGLGEALVTAVAQRAREDGAHELQLTVQQHDARAEALYRKLGFVAADDGSRPDGVAPERTMAGRGRVLLRLPL